MGDSRGCAAATGFTAFTGFHPTDQGNYIRFPAGSPGRGGCVYALPTAGKGGGGEAGGLDPLIRELPHRVALCCPSCHATNKSSVARCC